MKTEDQLVDIVTKALGRVKFGELSARIGVKKAWDMKKIKEENVGGDFLPPCMAGVSGIAVARRGEHSSRTHHAHLVVTIAPAEVVPSGA